MLRVVAVAGSGALLAAVACRPSSSSGSVAEPYSDSGYEDTTTDQGVDGTGPSPEAGSDGSFGSDAPLGVVAQPDGGEDSPSAFDGPVGVVANPDSGQD